MYPSADSVRLCTQTPANAVSSGPRRWRAARPTWIDQRLPVAPPRLLDRRVQRGEALGGRIMVPNVGRAERAHSEMVARAGVAGGWGGAARQIWQRVAAN